MTGLVIGDDHSVFLDAMSAVLIQRGYQVTVARSVRDTIESVREKQPDVCLIDRHFAGESGITAIGPMLAASGRTKILVLSADPDTEGIRQSLQAGAAGYLHKTRGVAALTRAIDRVQRGEVVVDVPKPRPARERPRSDDARRLAAFLTGRERECLNLLVEGLDTSGIATKLGVSAATVRTHVQSVLTKLGVHSRLEAASYAVRYGLLDDAPGLMPGEGTGLAGEPGSRGTRLVSQKTAGLADPARAGTARQAGSPRRYWPRCPTTWPASPALPVPASTDGRAPPLPDHPRDRPGLAPAPLGDLPVSRPSSESSG
jgi:two-component system, NarL family, nitrate/nitrite response regulator NarL